MANVAPDSQLRQLVATHPLPAGWSTPKLFAERIDVLGVGLHLVGLVSEHAREGDVAGSAAEVAGFPVARAYYELVERATILDAMARVDAFWINVDAERRSLGAIDPSLLFPQSPEPERWRYARSNGVALSTSWRDACRRASVELAERDLLLRAWYGRLALQTAPLPAVIAPSWHDAYEFTCCRASDGGGAHAIFVAGFPRAPEMPLVYGSAADELAERALHGAWRECVQRLGFLWDEPIPTRAPAPSPTPAYHQEYYLYPPAHATLRDWLQRGHAPVERSGAAAAGPLQPAGFVCLGDRNDHLYVAKCTRAVEFPLTFGHGHPSVALPAGSPLLVHPIA